jgi:hypothetical protein
MLSLLAGLIFLCVPCAWLCGKGVRLISLENLMEKPRLIGTWLGSVVWWNLGRAWLGVMLLRYAEAEFLGDASRHSLIISYNGVVHLAGLALQMVFYRRRDTEIPVPVSYAMGILLAVMPPSVSIPAIALGVATAAAARSFAIGWTVAGLVVAGLGVFLAVSKYQLAKAGLYFSLPLLAVLGSNRHFVLPMIPRPSSSAANSDAFSSRLR